MGIDREVLSIFRAWSQIPMLGAGYIGFGPFRHYSKGPYRRDDEQLHTSIFVVTTTGGLMVQLVFILLNIFGAFFFYQKDLDMLELEKLLAQWVRKTHLDKPFFPPDW